MSTMLHELRRERVDLSPGQRTALMLAIKRLLLGEVDEVTLRLRGPHLRIEQMREDRAQSV